MPAAEEAVAGCHHGGAVTGARVCPADAEVDIAVASDIEVVMAPQDKVNDRDPQLDAAIELALRTLADHPAATPPRLPPRYRRSSSA